MLAKEMLVTEFAPKEFTPKEFPQSGVDYATLAPRCPSCGRTMHLARVAPRANGLAGLPVFKCGECGVWVTESPDERRSI
jgi:transposase-like protein